MLVRLQGIVDELKDRYFDEKLLTKLSNSVAEKNFLLQIKSSQQYVVRVHVEKYDIKLLTAMVESEITEVYTEPAKNKGNTKKKNTKNTKKAVVEEEKLTVYNEEQVFGIAKKKKNQNKKSSLNREATNTKLSFAALSVEDDDNPDTSEENEDENNNNGSNVKSGHYYDLL